MREQSEAMQAFARAGRRVVYHLLQAAIEGLKAVEAVIEEVGNIGDKDDDDIDNTRARIEIE
ncbi:MAG TPA: hypothetical protein VFZ15_03910 [Acidimicrobiia bacterium]|jgi:hypothetical protein|nr:hypothetical protein [Acidimicrobiia bacterium]